MGTTVGGPMFQPHEDKFRRSVHKKEGGHYNIYGLKTGQGLPFLRALFPDGKADEMNFVLFSASGIHGSYLTLDEIQAGLTRYGYGEPPVVKNEDGDEEWPEDYHGKDVTILLVQSRIVGMTYGEARIETPEDLAYLKVLRASSWAAATKVGRAEEAKP